ncbi:MFS-type transporter SLC18B1, partial [Pseudolycoriella hygida]
LNFTKRQWLTLLVIGLADFCNAVCVSLQAPFFPQEAEKKGATATEYGLVFGVFELVVFLISPLYGQYLNRIGPKVLFNGGIFTTASSAICFGLLDKVEDHTSFVALAFTIRIIEALGNAAFLTASFAIIAKEFPDNVGTTFASLETFFGLGLIVGPMVGGTLYSLGGYFLPFVVLGSALFVTALLTACVLPKHPPEYDSGQAGLYALSAPFCGILVDKFINPKYSSCFGSLSIAVGFCLIGPASFLPIETKMSTIIAGLVLHGLGIACQLVASFSDALCTSIKKGLPDNIETYGLISGLWTSTFALGAFIGPSVSGALYDSIGFREATIFVIGLHSLVAVIIVIFLIIEKRQINPYKELSSTQSLLESRDSLFCSDSSLDKSLKSRRDSITIDQTGPGALSNLMMCNSYSNKQCQWSRSDRHDGLNLGITQYYGSVDMRIGHHDTNS